MTSGFLYKWGVVAGLLLLLTACAKPTPLNAPDGVELTPLSSYSTLESRVLLWMSGVEDVSVSQDVDLYRMVYRTRNGAGKEIAVSGLLALPRNTKPTHLASFQHGTTTSRDAVPSAPDGTGIAAAVLFAGNGYALIAPDYIGLGVSDERHPYLVADDAARAVTDMIDAARKIEGVPGGPVFLSGFSQGGAASVAATKALEARGEKVMGAAPVAGAYDLRNISLKAAMKGGAKQHSLYLAYIAWGYSDRYGHPLTSVLTTDYAAKVTELFSTPHKPDEFIESLPANPRDMFTPAFLSAFDNDGEHWFLTALADNDLSNWKPATKMRLYYGSADADVVPEEALSATKKMREMGADVTAVDVGPVGHDPSMLGAAPKILAWLQELDQGQPN
ncbi:MAG: alpha/beta fold hydrolase [Parvibaculum sp.]|nr:alpha/beta fold hydrolase [Parvibaculum sp.]